ncbi:MAG: hypothetical protein JSV01_01390 [Desulfobacterales bacterium]|nr:MAG: hypothetical protein JSV01_01390 [Desulfobacterales bacterium]
MKVWTSIDAPLAVIAVQISEIARALITGKVRGFDSGYLFGAHPAFVHSAVGPAVGSVINFMLGRKLVGR